MLTVYDLTREQINQLKEAYLDQHLQETCDECASYGELTNAADYASFALRLDPPAGRMEGIMPKFDATAVAAYETAAKMFPGLICNFKFDREERGVYWFTFRRRDLPDVLAPYSISVRGCNA